MQGINIKTDQGGYVICQPGSGTISSDKDVLDLLSYFYDDQPARLVIHATDLHPDFFDLKTGLLGKIFLKLSTYRVKTAFIVEIDRIESERFHELIYEHSRSHEIRFFEGLADAEKWLFIT